MQLLARQPGQEVAQQPEEAQQRLVVPSPRVALALHAIAAEDTSLGQAQSCEAISHMKVKLRKRIVQCFAYSAAAKPRGQSKTENFSKSRAGIFPKEIQTSRAKRFHWIRVILHAATMQSRLKATGRVPAAAGTCN